MLRRWRKWQIQDESQRETPLAPGAPWTIRVEQKGLELVIQILSMGIMMITIIITRFLPRD
jgi:hypothetical protein